jgi:hypothetical protein
MKLMHMERWTYQIREVNLVLVNYIHIKAKLIQAYSLLFFDANKLIFF